MTLPQLKKIAIEKGLEIPDRSRIPTYIKAILGEGEEAVEAEVEPVDVPEDETLEEMGIAATAALDERIIASGNGISPALLVVVFNGSVISRPISVEKAQELAGL